MGSTGFTYDPYSDEAMRDPYPLYRVLRERFPVYRLERYDGWALSRFADVYDTFNDHDNFATVEGDVFAQETVSTPLGGPPPPASLDPLAPFIRLDEPEHSQVRQKLGGGLRPRPVARLEETIRAQARELLDHLVPKGRFNLTIDYGGQVAAATACRLVGLDPALCSRVLDLVNASVRREPGVPGFGAGMWATEELRAMLLDLVTRRRAAGADGTSVMADSILNAEIAGRRLTDDEIAEQLRQILVGATETVPKVVAAGLMELCRSPEQRAEVAADPANCAKAFTEMMRLLGPAQWFGRTLRNDAVVAGQQMRAGQRVFLLIASANRDDREFDDAETFRWDREIERHVALGQGAHFCIGSHVAQLEGRVLLEELLRRIPDYTIDESGLERPPSEFQLGYTTVPLVVP